MKAHAVRVRRSDAFLDVGVVNEPRRAGDLGARLRELDHEAGSALGRKVNVADERVITKPAGREGKGPEQHDGSPFRADWAPPAQEHSPCRADAGGFSANTGSAATSTVAITAACDLVRRRSPDEQRSRAPRRFGNPWLRQIKRDRAPERQCGHAERNVGGEQGPLRVVDVALAAVGITILDLASLRET